eukprot:TRINITY_DN156_c0_g3_i4.p1 TRINITY_DN156_c0_g3~~TRINITY_DN156_c0_g3_i4.p1  ORF type:complete len:377 (+),score=65.77 TRINITY_DN156_c0_g3_i4:113-1243(+)
MAEETDEPKGLEDNTTKDKYQQAGKIVQDSLLEVLQNCLAGVAVLDLCKHGDTLLRDKVSKVFMKKKKMKKGIAFPTCISVNHCVGHNCPFPEDPPQILKPGDVVKVDMGIHIDGFMVSSGHTAIVPPESGVVEGPTTGRIADVICATYYASECAYRLCQPGRKASEITKAINQVSKIFNCNPVRGVLSHEIRRHEIDEKKVIPAYVDFETKFIDFEFEANTAYCIDIIMSTGDGKVKEGTQKTSVYRRNPGETYRVKLNGAKFLVAQVSQNYSSFPFSLRYIDDKRAKLGLRECVTHNLLTPYPVLFEKEGEFVAQFKFTVLVLPNNTWKLTNFPPPFVSSQFSVDGNEDIAAIMNLQTDRRKKPTPKAETMDTQ